MSRAPEPTVLTWPMSSGPHASDSLVVAKTGLRSQYCPSKSPWPPRPRKSQSALIN